MTNKTIMIRPFKAQDLELIIDLWLRTNQSAHDFIAPTYWQRHSEDLREAFPKANISIADDDNQIVGFIGIVEPHYIAGLFIDDRYQRKGIGALLLEHAKTKYPKLTLHCYSNNNKAVSFYLKNHFSIVGEAANLETGKMEYEMLWSKS